MSSEEVKVEAENRYSSRKWRIAVGVLLGVFALFAFNRLSEGVFSDLAKWTMGLYFGANVIYGIGLKVAELVAPKSS